MLVVRVQSLEALHDPPSGSLRFHQSMPSRLSEPKLAGQYLFPVVSWDSNPQLCLALREGDGSRSFPARTRRDVRYSVSTMDQSAWQIPSSPAAFPAFIPVQADTDPYPPHNPKSLDISKLTSPFPSAFRTFLSFYLFPQLFRNLFGRHNPFFYFCGFSSFHNEKQMRSDIIGT
jgi:hypothetical protein